MPAMKAALTLLRIRRPGYHHQDGENADGGGEAGAQQPAEPAAAPAVGMVADVDVAKQAFRYGPGRHVAGCARSWAQDEAVRGRAVRDAWCPSPRRPPRIASRARARLARWLPLTAADTTIAPTLYEAAARDPKSVIKSLDKLVPWQSGPICGTTKIQHAKR